MTIKEVLGMIYLGVTVIIGVFLISLSLSGAVIPPPDDWLLAWTDWAISAVGIAVAARVLWVGSDALRKYVNG